MVVCLLQAVMLILSVPNIGTLVLESGNVSPGSCLCPVSISLVCLVSTDEVGLVELTHVCV